MLRQELISFLEIADCLSSIGIHLAALVAIHIVENDQQRRKNSITHCCSLWQFRCNLFSYSLEVVECEIPSQFLYWCECQRFIWTHSTPLCLLWKSIFFAYLIDCYRKRISLFISIITSTIIFWMRKKRAILIPPSVPLLRTLFLMVSSHSVINIISFNEYEYYCLITHQ